MLRKLYQNILHFVKYNKWLNLITSACLAVFSTLCNLKPYGEGKSLVCVYIYYLRLKCCPSARHSKETDLQLHMICKMTLNRITYDDRRAEERHFASITTELTNIKESDEGIVAEDRRTITSITNILFSGFCQWGQCHHRWPCVAQPTVTLHIEYKTFN